jgi:organic radical activating enzyme
LTHMKKYHIPKLGFAINNVCNFNCENCNRLSNYSFSGHHNWVDYSEIYKKWAEILSCDKWYVLGGEPTINKDYLEWLKGLHKLWPDAHGRILTNGSLLKPTDHELYDFLKSTNGKVVIAIGLHNINRKKEMVDFCLAFLKTPYPMGKESFNKNFIESYQQIKDSNWPDLEHFSEWYDLPENIKNETETIFSCSPELLKKTMIDDYITSSREYIEFIDENNVVILISNEDYFHKSTLTLDPLHNHFNLSHNSDIHEAHAACINYKGECTQFVGEKLYKCPVASDLSKFSQQYVVNMTPEDRDIIYGYKPASIVDDTPEELDNWFKNRQNPIDMCKFCTVDYTEDRIFAGKKKIFIKKIKQIVK